MPPEAIPFKQTPRSFGVTVVIIILVVSLTQFFAIHALHLLRNVIRSWNYWSKKVELSESERGGSDEFSKIERGESDTLLDRTVEEKLDYPIEPLKDVGRDVTWDDEKTLLDLPLREISEELDTDVLNGTFDQRSATYIDDLKSTDQEMLQSFVDASSEGIKEDPVELLFGCVASDVVRTCNGSSPPPRSSSQAPATESANSRNTKRSRLNQEEPEDWEKNEGRKPTRKKPKDTSQPVESEAFRRRYACPYNKHNPRKFRNSCDVKFMACDGPGFVSIARTK
jgi:hypothetical protein